MVLLQVYTFPYFDWVFASLCAILAMKRIYSVRQQRYHKVRQRISKIQNASPIAQPSIDIPSGGWLNTLSLDDPQQWMEDREKVVYMNCNPFLKQHQPAILENTKPLRNSDSTPSPLIRESNWKHIAIGTGKPFLRQTLTMGQRKEKHPISAKSFRELFLQQQQRPSLPGRSQPNALATSSLYPWQSLTPYLKSAEKRLSPIIRESMVGQLDVDTGLQELQQCISGVSLKDTQRFGVYICSIGRLIFQLPIMVIFILLFVLVIILLVVSHILNLNFYVLLPSYFQG